MTAAFLALLTYGLLAKAPKTGIDEQLARAEASPAPGFQLPVLHAGDPGSRLQATTARALGDGRLSLEELRGTPVALNFWASWCVPCQEEAPVLERAWRDARRQGVLFVGLNMQDLTDDARDFVREFGVSYPNVRDRNREVATEWGVTGLPETFFVSAEGRVVGHVIGVLSADQLAAGLEAARSGRVQGTVSGGERRSTR